MHLDLSSFPTRRSSDLFAPGAAIQFFGTELFHGNFIAPVFKAPFRELHNVPFVYKGHAFTLLLDGIIEDRKSTRLNSSHVAISYAVLCLKKKNTRKQPQ